MYLLHIEWVLGETNFVARVIEEDVLVLGIGIARHAEDLERTIESDEGGVENLVGTQLEAAEEVEEQDPIAIDEEVGESAAHLVDLAEEEVDKKEKDKGIDKHDVVLAHGYQLVVEDIEQRAGEESLKVADRDDESLGRHIGIVDIGIDHHVELAAYDARYEANAARDDGYMEKDDTVADDE